MIKNNLRPWYCLNINVSNAVKLDFDKLIKDLKNKPYHIWQYHTAELDQLYSVDWLSYMESIGMPVQGTLVFYRAKGYQHPTIHTDMPHGKSGKLGLAVNWCIGLDDADMVWYETPVTPVDISVTETGAKYYSWPANSAPEIDRRCIGATPTIVRVDIPHNVDMKTHSRLVISARINVKTENWSDVVKKVKHLIVE